MDTLLDITNIDLIIGQRQIPNQVSLQLKSDEILTIIGPNGAGKTSLVRIALGLLQPTSGQVIRRPDT